MRASTSINKFLFLFYGEGLRASLVAPSECGEGSAQLSFNPLILDDCFDAMISVFLLCSGRVLSLLSHWRRNQRCLRIKQWVPPGWMRQLLLWSKYFLRFSPLFLPQPVLQKLFVCFLWQPWALVRAFCKSLQLGYGYKLIFTFFFFLSFYFFYEMALWVWRSSFNILTWTEEIIEKIECCGKEKWCETLSFQHTTKILSDTESQNLECSLPQHQFGHGFYCSSYNPLLTTMFLTKAAWNHSLYIP